MGREQDGLLSGVFLRFMGKTEKSTLEDILMSREVGEGAK